MKIYRRFVNFGPGKLEKWSLKVLEKSWIFFKLYDVRTLLIIFGKMHFLLISVWTLAASHGNPLH